MRIAIIVAGLLSLGASSAPTVAPEPDRLAQFSATCFKTGENAPPGSMTKICYYDCLGSPYAITVKSYELCPLTIQR